MSIGKTTAGTGLILAACAACCAPLIAPPIIAAIAAGGAGLALVGQLGLALVVVAAGGLYLLSRRKAAPNADFRTLMAGQCGCCPACDTGSNEERRSLARWMPATSGNGQRAFVILPGARCGTHRERRSR